MMKDVSVIGCGNMGGAIVRGLDRAGGYAVTAIDLDPDALDRVAGVVVRTTTDLATAQGSEMVVLAVKPHIVESALGSLDLHADQTLVTLAAGVPREFVADRTDAAVVRVMPNLAAETADMAAAATEIGVTDEVRDLLDDLGQYVTIEEECMDVATAVNGSGPAFVFYLIEAMKDAGVEAGLDPAQAETVAAQTFKGAAETVQQDERSVDELIDAVCSPGGTTIEGMNVLWDSDADQAMRDAVAAAAARSREIAAGFDDE